MTIEIMAGRNAEGAYVVIAYVNEEYAGSTSFYGYTKREALSQARHLILKQGGLGLYANVIKRA